MKKLTLVLLIALACVNANLLSNGNFEQNSCTNPAFCTYFSTELPGWTVTSGSVDLVFSSSLVWFAYEGSWSLDVNGNTVGAMYQDVATTVGTQYQLTFKYSGNANPGCANLKQMNIDATGNSAQTVTFAPTSNSNMNWQSGSYSFSATSSTTRLSFTGLNSGCAGIVLDDMVLSAVNQSPLAFCAQTDQSQWNVYGQGYYCSHANQGFIQCWGSGGNVYGEYQNCAAGTTCRCYSGEECSSNGQQSPCA